MKKITIIFLIVFLFASCSKEEKKAFKEYGELTKIKLSSIQKINDSSDHQFYYPKIIYDGSKMFFTSKNYDGIWYYDFETQLIVNVSQINGVGKEIEFSKDSKKIYYVLPSMTIRTKEKNFSLVEYNLKNKSREIVLNNIDGISSIAELDSNIICFWENDDVIFYDLINKKIVHDFTSDNYLLLNNKNNFRVYGGDIEIEKVELLDTKFSKFISHGVDSSFYYYTKNGSVKKYKVFEDHFTTLGKFENFGVSQNSNLVFYSEGSKIYMKSLSQLNFVEIDIPDADSVFNPEISITNDSFVFNNEKGEVYFLQFSIKEKLTE